MCQLVTLFSRSIWRRWFVASACVLPVGLSGFECSAGNAAPNQGSLRVATFQCDVTPPVGKPVGLGFIPTPESVEHPLLAKGVVLSDAGGTSVLCTIDWMEVHNTSYDFLREQIAAAASTAVSRVAVHCLHQLYFTGCGGDIGMGKYNDGTREARTALTSRILDAMKRSITTVQLQAPSPIRWQTLPLHFPPRRDPAYSEPANRKLLADNATNDAARLKPAINLAWIERMKTNGHVELSCLTIGSVRLLHLPGEPFVQYQLAAQRMQPESFVLVAGYGDCGMGYIGGDRIYTDRGGYEQTYAFSGPCEHVLLSAIEKLLAGEGNDTNPDKDESSVLVSPRPRQLSVRGPRVPLLLPDAEEFRVALKNVQQTDSPPTDRGLGRHRMPKRSQTSFFIMPSWTAPLCVSDSLQPHAGKRFACSRNRDSSASRRHSRRPCQPPSSSVNSSKRRSVAGLT